MSVRPCCRCPSAVLSCVIGIVLAGCVGWARADAHSGNVLTLYDFAAKDIRGNDVQLSSLRSTPVVLVVNVASGYV